MKPPRRKAHNSTLSAPLKAMRKVNPERAARREELGLTYGPVHDYVRSLPCALAGNQHHVCGFFADRPNVESHHIRSVGSGGEDRNNTISACPKLHDEFHALPLSDICRKYHKDFKSMAAELTAQFDAENA